jgi:excisionase family DNA binding protein
MRRACAQALLRGTKTLDASAPRGWAGYGQWLERSMEGEVLTVQELARILRVNTSTIYRRIKRGGWPAFRVSSDWRFDGDSVEAWLKSQMVGPKDWRLLAQ